MCRHCWRHFSVCSYRFILQSVNQWSLWTQQLTFCCIQPYWAKFWEQGCRELLLEQIESIAAPFAAIHCNGENHQPGTAVSRVCYWQWRLFRVLLSKFPSASVSQIKNETASKRTEWQFAPILIASDCSMYASVLISQIKLGSWLRRDTQTFSDIAAFLARSSSALAILRSSITETPSSPVSAAIPSIYVNNRPHVWFPSEIKIMAPQP